MDDKLHFQPVWGHRADAEVRMPVMLDGVTIWERIAARRTGEHRFEICCIPFFVKNLALGDEVSTLTTDAGEVVDEVVARSGYYVYRIWLGEKNEEQRTAAFRTIAAELHGALGCELEAYSAKLLGAAAPSLEAAERTVNWLDDRESDGMLEWEAANTLFDDA